MNLKKTLIINWILIFIFAIICQLYNYYHTHYIGNPYLPTYAHPIILYLCLIYSGVSVTFGPSHYVTKTSKRAIAVYLCLWVLVLLTDSVQYTPFKPIDHLLYQADQLLFFDTQRTLAWVFEHPAITKLLTYSYAFLEIEMVLLFLCLIVINDNQCLKETLFLLLSTALIGFSLYYFFPTLAPASILKSPYFFKEQLDTGIKFTQIHHYVYPSTMEGGMIALPSFHCIWALITQRYTKRWPYIWWLLLPINTLLITACVALGWHYLIDIIFSCLIYSLIVFLLGIYLRENAKGKLNITTFRY